jgi:trans-aconitate methyltransferase
MSNWDADTYLAFADLRSRPGLELTDGSIPARRRWSITAVAPES